MTNFDFNTNDLRARTFQGFLQFQDPGNSSNYYRLKERQEMSVAYSYETAAHYTDAGVKNLDPAGYNHIFTMNIKVTSDMIDRVSPPTDTKTISYWIYQWDQFTPLTMTFVTTMQHLSGPSGFSTEKFSHITFTVMPSQFGPIIWNQTLGAHEMSISGEVLSTTSILRSTT